MNRFAWPSFPVFKETGQIVGHTITPSFISVTCVMQTIILRILQTIYERVSIRLDVRRDSGPLLHDRRSKCTVVNLIQVCHYLSAQSRVCPAGSALCGRLTTLRVQCQPEDGERRSSPKFVHMYAQHTVPHDTQGSRSWAVQFFKLRIPILMKACGILRHCSFGYFSSVAVLFAQAQQCGTLSLDTDSLGVRMSAHWSSVCVEKNFASSTI